MRVRLWAPWPLDGRVLEPGEILTVAPAIAEEICAAGAGEVLEGERETAVQTSAERAVVPRAKPRKRRGKGR